MVLGCQNNNIVVYHHVIPESTDIKGLKTSPNENSESKEPTWSTIRLKSKQRERERNTKTSSLASV